MRVRLLSLCFLFAALGPAAAQDPGTTNTLMSGNVDNGFLVAPDFKFTDINGDFANLAGAYGGWLVDKKFLIGGGVYGLTNGSGPDEMTYGGGVFEYFVNQGSLVNVSVKGLIGGGSATIGAGFPGFDNDFDFGDIDPGRFGFGRGPGNGPGNGPGTAIGFPPNIGRGDIDGLLGRFGFDDLDFLDRDFATSSSFFIAEPEVNVVLNISEMFRLGVGGSYRFIGGAGRLNNRLDGFAASVALKMVF